VSVLFADIPGFTALSERLDPEQVSEIMHRMFDIVLRVVHEHGGRVNQFLGDGVMALFGEAPAEFRVRMAINTEPVVVGTISAALRTDYTATGSTTSVASRLLCIAEPGQIVLTGRTRELVTGRYDFEELGEMSLTESLETVAVYALTCETMKYIRSRGLAAV
jgi:adenylate cyclase